MNGKREQIASNNCPGPAVLDFGKVVSGKKMSMSSLKEVKRLLRDLATKQPGMGQCLAAGSSEMQPLSCWKFIQVKALMMMASANE